MEGGGAAADDDVRGGGGGTAAGGIDEVVDTCGGGGEAVKVWCPSRTSSTRYSLWCISAPPRPLWLDVMSPLLTLFDGRSGCAGDAFIAVVRGDAAA